MIRIHPSSRNAPGRRCIHPQIGFARDGDQKRLEAIVFGNLIHLRAVDADKSLAARTPADGGCDFEETLLEETLMAIILFFSRDDKKRKQIDEITARRSH